jgi:hypothetical protein
MTHRPFLLLLVLLACAPGCAPAAEPLRVRAADLARLEAAPDLRVRPIVIEFQEGDTLPVDFTLSGDLLELAPGTSLTLRARRRFWLRLGVDGLTVSLDGVRFGERPKAPGSFRIGLQASPAGSRVKLDIKTPTHAAPGG